MPGGQAHYTDEFRAYRSASFTTGSGGAYAQLALDAQSSLVDQNTLEIVGGDVLMNVFGIARLGYAITCASAPSLSRIKVRVTRDPGGAREAVIAEHAHLAPSTGGDFTVAAGGITCDVVDTDTIRIDIASIGADSIAVTTGDNSTWASFLVVL